MAITFHTVTGNLSQLLGDDFGGTDGAKIRALRVVTNLDPAKAPIDLTNNKILLGGQTATVNADGTFTIPNLIDYNSTNVNPTGIQYQVSIDYIDSVSVASRIGNEVKTWSSGWLNITADANLATLVPTALAPPVSPSYAVPAGGTTGQVLTKTSSGYAWADASGSGSGYDGGQVA